MQGIIIITNSNFSNGIITIDNIFKVMLSNDFIGNTSTGIELHNNHITTINKYRI